MMKRRNFLAGALAAGAMPLAARGAEHGKPQSRQMLEWIRFEVLNNRKKGALHRFLEETVFPGLSGLGLGPLGAFTPKYGAHGGDIFLLVPHPDLDSFLHSWDRLEQDPAYRKVADTELAEPFYERMETSLMEAFSHMPQVGVPAAVAGKRGRIFELRTYEAHNRPKLNRKVEMFNEGGEIRIFRETGLHPVFFGKMLSGPNMPNLTYMLGFESMEQRDANWKTFVESPGWAAIKDLPRYKDTVSTISDTILAPTGYSEI